MINKSVAIIGAGLSAAVCAKSLSGLVKNIVIFEQSEFVGGRLNFSKYLPTTPSFTVSTHFFQQIIDRWMLEGFVSEITPWNVEVSKYETNSLENNQTEYTVKPRMTGFVEHLFEGLSVRLNTEVTDIEKTANQWRLFNFEGEYLGKFDSIIISAATTSVYDIAKPSDLLLSQINKIQYSPVWSVVITLSDSENLAFDNATFINSSLATCFNAHDNKVVLIASPEWSEKFAALSIEQVTEELSKEFCLLVQINKDSVINSEAKFWPTKAPINTLGEDCIFDDATGLGACGDWCTSPRVEGAVLSGFSIADRVMKYFT